MKSVLLVLSILAVSLAACGGEDEENREPIQGQPFEIVEPTAAIIEPGCATETLEDWYEGIAITTPMFNTEAFTHINNTRESVSFGITSLTDMLNIIAFLEAPECMADTHGIILDYMNTVIDAYNDFSVGNIESAELTEQVEAQRTRYDTEIVPLINAAETLLAERFRGN